MSNAINVNYICLLYTSVSGKTGKRSSVTTTISLISWNRRDTSGVKRMRPLAPRISMKSIGCMDHNSPIQNLHI